MVQQTIQAEMALSAFLDEYAKAPFELAEGKIIPLSPNVLGHQLVVKALFRILDTYLAADKQGEVFFETPFVLSDRPDWVKGSRTPDISYFSIERWTTYLAQIAEAKGKPIILVPDLAVEVVSPNDLYTDIQDKIDGYLADGVPVVWIIDPQRRKVIIHVADGDSQVTLRENDTLSGGEVLPNFSVPAKRLFD